MALDAGVAADNRLSDGPTALSYKAADQVASSGYVYDANGNLRKGGTTGYTYDAANRLIQTVRGGVTTIYGYLGWSYLVRESGSGFRPNQPPRYYPPSKR